MATTNLQQWNPTAANQQNDATYAADSQRAGGATDPSVFLSVLANKAFFQWSTYLTALFAAFAAKGFTTSDSNISTLTAQCANFLTSADIKPPQHTVAFSPTPVFDCNLATGFRIDLSGNVTSSTLINMPVAGTIITFFIVSASPGTFDFAWPSNVANPPIVRTQSAGNLLTYEFVSDGSNLYPLSTFVEYVQGLANAAQTSANTALAEIAALALVWGRFDVTGSRSFGTTYTNTYGYGIHVTGYGTTSGSSVGSVQCLVNGGSDFANTVAATVSGGACGFSFVVPPGATYEIISNSLTNGQGSAVNGVGRWIETTVHI